jgi:putative membrane protein
MAEKQPSFETRRRVLEQASQDLRMIADIVHDEAERSRQERQEVAMMYEWGPGWGGGMFFGPLFMIALLVLSVVVIVALVRWFSGERVLPRESNRTPRDILDERFAKGEIDREDYDARRKALGA